MIDELLLLSGNDIPFLEARVTIHQPRLKEIALIGEEPFLMGSHFLLFNKNILSQEDKIGLEDKSDFHIFMSVMNSSDKAIHKTDALMVLTLIFPQYKVEIKKDRILLQSENFSSSINEQNFYGFQNIVNQMFCLKSSDAGRDDEFNPADELAARIAEKIKKGRREKAESKGEMPEEIKIFGREISILAVGLQKNIPDLMEYTVYQIKDEFERFQKKISFDFYVQAKMAGAQDLEEVENWME